MRIDLNKWINNEQKKHRLCGCGCGKEIIIKKHHHTKGIPKYYNGHRSPMMGFQNVGEWVRGQQGNHICQCGCGEVITIQKWHHKKIRGVPKYIYGHVSEKTKNKIADTKTGVGLTEQHKHNISKGNIGKKLSCETKKKISDVRKTDQFGDKNPSWNGGTSFEPYCHKFNNELKERIRNRDNRTCQRCGIKENGKCLSVHHIHYDKENCYPDLITLCHTCNAKANGNRDWYEIYYMRKLLFNKTKTVIWNMEFEFDMWNYGQFI